MNKTIDKRYKLIEVVGEGGMNTVYKAEDLRTGELVAIKILNGEFNKDEEVVKRFHLESEAIQKLNHDNIVKVFDIGEEGGQNYIVMELLKPHTLKEVISSSEKYFNNEDIVHMSLQILRGIKNAHDNKIVHRDIKPQNILIDEEGRLKVSDFGIARVVNSDTMHNLRDAIGSVHYASPEQSRGSIVDERSDIYSFGIVLYELSTGRLPFDGDSAIAIALKHTKNRMVDPSHLNLNLNPSIELIIKKCIQKEPSQRFQSVEEIIELFEELKKNPDEELGKEFSQLFVVPTETIDMNSIAPYLDGEKEDKNRVDVSEDKNKINMVPMIITVSAAILIGILVLAFIFVTPNRKVESMRPFELDDLEGMSYTEASELLASKRLRIEQIEAVHHDEIKANHIISQIPKAKAIVQEGKTIKVKVSLGKKEAKAPKLVGLSIQEAKVQLRNEDISFEIEEEYAKEKKGTVTKQWPREGSKLGKNDKVTLTVSLGSEPKMHLMPSLTGMHLDLATKTLANLNMVVGSTEYEFDNNFRKDVVIWQSISPNVSVEENTVVNLKISKGRDESQGQTPEPSPEDGNTENPGGNTQEPGEQTPADPSNPGNGTETPTPPPGDGETPGIPEELQ
ncbi:MAG: Stk1 family PASTA domain-containing Ser/Thr kinase [Bacillota bacterium]|nr:Stk1 family PASTA domain-containing Ser/Thr kinase [Bacillota bacterium]